MPESIVKPILRKAAMAATATVVVEFATAALKSTWKKVSKQEGPILEEQ